VQWMLFCCKRCAVTNIMQRWDEVLAKISEYNLNEIKLPRHMRPPSRFEQKLKAFESHRFGSPEEFYRVYYFSFIDAVISNITDRFAQPDVKLYAGMETVATGACRKQDTTSQLDDLCCKYDDFDKSRLTLQLRMLPDLCPLVTTVFEAVAQFRTKSHEVRALFDEVERLFKFLLVIPASSATAERSFSSLRQLNNNNNHRWTVVHQC